jgi:hypothetical protein
MDFFNRAVEQARQLQQLALEAAQKSFDQAQPLIQESLTRALELQKTLIEQTPTLTAAAQEQANAAMQHAGVVIATGKTVLEAGTQQAQQHLSIFADQAKKAADAAINVANASAQTSQGRSSQAPGGGTQQQP